MSLAQLLITSILWIALCPIPARATSDHYGDVLALPPHSPSPPQSPARDAFEARGQRSSITMSPARPKDPTKQLTGQFARLQFPNPFAGAQPPPPLKEATRKRLDMSHTPASSEPFPNPFPAQRQDNAASTPPIFGAAAKHVIGATDRRPSPEDTVRLAHHGPRASLSAYLQAQEPALSPHYVGLLRTISSNEGRLRAVELLARRERAKTRLKVAELRHLSKGSSEREHSSSREELGMPSKTSGKSASSEEGSTWQQRGVLDRLHADLDDQTILHLSRVDSKRYKAWWRRKTGRAGSKEQTVKSWDLRRDSAYGF